MNILIENCAVLDAGAPWGYQPARHVVIDGRRIISVTATRPEGTFDRVLDGRRRLVIPGLINAHTHSPENYTRATDNRLPLEPSGWSISTWAGGVFSPARPLPGRRCSASSRCSARARQACWTICRSPPEPSGRRGRRRYVRLSGQRHPRGSRRPLFNNIRLDTDDGQARAPRHGGHRFREAPSSKGTPAKRTTRSSRSSRKSSRAGTRAEDGRLRCLGGPERCSVGVARLPASLPGFRSQPAAAAFTCT